MGEQLFLDFVVDKIYFYYDGPKLFTARKDDQIFVFNAVDEADDMTEVFLAAEVNKETVKALEQNQITLFEVFDKAPKLLIVGQDVSKIQDVPSEWMPMVGAMLT